MSARFANNMCLSSWSGFGLRFLVFARGFRLGFSGFEVRVFGRAWGVEGLGLRVWNFGVWGVEKG